MFSGCLWVKLTGHGSSLEIREQESSLGVKNNPEVSVYSTRVGNDIVTKIDKALWEEDADTLEDFVGLPDGIVMKLLDIWS